MKSDRDQGSCQSKSHGSIFRLITASPIPLTMKQIAVELGISLPTVYQSVGELIEQDLVRSCGEQSSSGGRRPTSVGVNAGARVSLGVSLTGDSINTVAIDLQGRILYSSFITLEGPRSSIALADLVQEETDRFLKATSFSRGLLLGAVIAIPGIIDHGSETVSYAPAMGLSAVPTSLLTDGLPMSARVENDAVCGGYAEHLARPAISNLAYLSLDRGVGGSIFLGGSPYSGTNNRSAEFGHICVEENGAACACGRCGCLEAYCSTSRIERDSGMSLGRFFNALERKDSQACKLWNDFVEHLARGIVTITTCLDCELVIGGRLSQYLDPHLYNIMLHVREREPFGSKGSVMALSKNAQDGVPLGAAFTLVDDFINRA